MSTDPSASEKQAFSKRRVLLFVLAFSIWLFFLVRSIQVFPPGSAYVTSFNSDTAIPVLMANENRPITIYSAYYYGQDRFGAWPFLLADLFHRATNYHWSNRALFIVQAIWLFIGAILFATFNRRDDLLVGLLYLLPLCLHVTGRWNLFDLSQPYAWQTTALIFSWWSLRRFCERSFGLVEDGNLKLFVWGALTFWFALLAIFSSVVSGPILFFLLILEVLRSVHKASGGEALKNVVGRILQPVLLIAAPVIIELLTRANFHRYSLKHFGGDNRTLIELDRGHLIENFVNQWARFCNSPWWLLSLLPILVLIALSVRYIYLLKGNRKKLLGKLTDLFLSDNAVLVIGTFVIGIINLIVTALVSHVRNGGYNVRYLAPSYLFLSFSGLLAFLVLIDEMKRYKRWARAFLAAASLVFLLIKFPAAETRPEYPLLKETALTLSQKAPGSVLLGGYWYTYVFAGLDPNDSLLPLPAEGESLRMPWMIEALRRSDRVIVENHLPALGGTESPAPHLVQYGVSLRLLVPKWYVNTDFTFSLYEKEGGQP
ncbi:MAG TPA: hypothetical protein VKB86_19895 [Pyrinomonadaceae bacterium]|nr:hypothetical protein [Pyrinomonadaceae bacterium]